MADRNLGADAGSVATALDGAGSVWAPEANAARAGKTTSQRAGKKVDMGILAMS